LLARATNHFNFQVRWGPLVNWGCWKDSGGDGDEDDEGGARGSRDPPEVAVAVTGGSLRLFPPKGTRSAYIRANCDCGHGDCNLSRTLNEAEKCVPGSVAEAQGRPVGLLLAWLDKGRSCAVRDKKAHKDLLVQGVAPSLRRRLRAQFKTDPLSAPLFAAERRKRGGEDSEPEQECGRRGPPRSYDGA